MAETLSVGDRPINLTQVLKLAGWAAHGGQAKAMIADGLVLVNGQVETRKRRQMAVGDTPELDATRGGTVLGASRDYVSSDDTEALARVAGNLARLKVEGLICVGGDGTLNGMQPLSDLLPCVLAPKTIDNDLGLNYPDEHN